MSSRHDHTPSPSKPSPIISPLPLDPPRRVQTTRPPHSRNNSSRSALRSAEEQLQDIRDGDTSWQRSNSPSIVDSPAVDELPPLVSESPSKDREDTVRVYLHNVRKTDTLPLILLAYEISATVLKKSNRLWATDSIQSRKVLYLPVEECGVKARPCEAPQGKKQNASAADILDNKDIPTSVANGEWPVRLDRPFANQEDETRDSETTDKWVNIPDIGAIQIVSIPAQKLSYFPTTQRRNTMERSTSLPTLESLVAEDKAAARDSIDSVASRSSLGSLVEDGVGRVVRFWHDNQGRKKWAKIGKDLIEL